MFKKLFFAASLLTQLSLFGDMSLAEQLETQIWQDIKEKKWDDMDKQLAPYFQLALFDGARTKAQYVNFAKALHLSDFTFSNFVVTEGPGVLIVTYDVTVSETISGMHLTSKAVRQSVWQKNGDKWQWIAHSILLPIQR